MPEKEYVWVDEGAARSAIVWAQTAASPVPPFAAGELQSYIGKMTGAAVPVLYDPVLEQGSAAHLSATIVILAGMEAERYVAAGPDARKIFWETNPFKRADLALAGKKDDAYVIRSEPNRMVLAGTNGRGLLYAVYDLLERLNVAFFAPGFRFYGPYAEAVPGPETSLAVPAMEALEEPDFAYRRKYIEEGCSHTAENIIQLIDWMAKKRLNCLVYPRDYESLGLVKWETWRERLMPELEKRGLLLEVGGHGYDSFLPESLRSEQPDWFHDADEPIYKSDKTGPNVFRFRNREALEAYIANVRTYLQSHPEIAVFDGWPPDSATWAAADIAAFGSIPNAQAYIANELAQALAESLPHVKLAQISYVPATEPPDRGNMLDSGVLVDCALYDRSYSAPIHERGSPQNEHYVGVFRAWREQGFQGDLCVLEYYAKYSWHSLPVLLPRLIAEDMAYFHRIGINGIGIYSEPANWLVYELNHLLLADLSWSARLPIEEYMKRYSRARFGPAAAEGMRRYLETVERTGRLIFDRPEGNLKNREVAEAAVRGYRQARDELERVLADATPNTAEAFLIRRLLWNAQYAAAVTEIVMYSQLGQSEEELEAKRKTKQLVDAHYLDGIILKTTFSMRKYTEIPRGRAGKLAVAWIYDLYRDAWQ